MENLRELLTEQLDIMVIMNPADLVEVHNVYCRLINDNDSVIYSNDLKSLKTLLGKRTDYMTFALKIFHGGYNPYHDYVKLDGGENLDSFNDPTEHIYNSDMVDTIMENLREFEHLLELEY